MSNYSSLISSEEVSQIFRIFETFKRTAFFLLVVVSEMQFCKKMLLTLILQHR